MAHVVEAAGPVGGAHDLERELRLELAQLQEDHGQVVHEEQGIYQRHGKLHHALVAALAGVQDAHAVEEPVGDDKQEDEYTMSRARSTKTRGREALGRRKNRAQLPNSRMSSLKATEMKRPSQAVPHGSSSSRHSSGGSSRKASGVRKDSRASVAPAATPRCREQSSGTLSSMSLAMRVRSSWEMLCSEVPVTTVVVSPQLSSCIRRGRSNVGREGGGRDTGEKVSGEKTESKAGRGEKKVINKHAAIKVFTELHDMPKPGLCRDGASETWALWELHAISQTAKNYPCTLRAEGTRQMPGSRSARDWDPRSDSPGKAGRLEQATCKARISNRYLSSKYGEPLKVSG